MKHLKIFSPILCLLVIVSSALTYSQIIFTYPSEKEIDIVVEAACERAGESFEFSYDLKSLPSSAQRVRRFAVVHLSQIESFANPNGWWGTIAPATIERVAWSGIDTVYMVEPGASLHGLRLVSFGLPSPGDFYATGWVPVPNFLPEEWPDSVIGGVFPENSVHGRTMVPRTPPTPFNSLHFLDTLKSYIYESRTLGWITSQPVAEKYLALVDSARAQIARNVSKVARTTLNTILQEVETDSGASLTSEAYALLRFNTEYLLEQLRDE